MTNAPIELGLRVSRESLPLSHFDRLLDLTSHALVDPDDAAGRDALRACIRDYRDALQHFDSEALQQRGEALLNTFADAATTHAKLRAARRAEVAELVGLFRDMTVSLVGEGSATATELTASASRFAALGYIGDIRLLKDRLGKEVSHLKDVAAKKEQQWARAADDFTQKVNSLQQQLRLTQEEASVDSLTGVANRRMFDHRLAEFLADHRHSFSLVFIDVDDFKAINDQDGHDAGDRVLKAIAHSFATSVRSIDVVARLGGDEFALLFDNVTLRQAENRVAAINGTLAALLDAEGLRATTVSWGIAEFSAGDTAQSLCKRADDALYASKRRGRGRVTAIPAPLLRDLRGRKTDSSGVS
jgi:diguanylate cyclase (GGDEF)-like protein